MDNAADVEKAWPMTTEQAVDEVLSHLTEEEKQEIARTPFDDPWTPLHSKIAADISIKWDLFRDPGGFLPGYIETMSIVSSLWSRLGK